MRAHTGMLTIICEIEPVNVQGACLSAKIEPHQKFGSCYTVYYAYKITHYSILLFTVLYNSLLQQIVAS